MQESRNRRSVMPIPTALVNVLMFVTAGGVFFIRDDWPFGFNGSLLAIWGATAVCVIGVLRFSASARGVPIGASEATFFVWLASMALTVGISGLTRGYPSASIFMWREIVVIALIFSAGFLAVKMFRVHPARLLAWCSVWVLVAAIPIIQHLVAADQVSRVKIAASVNYVSASFGAFAVFFAARIMLGSQTRAAVLISLLALLAAFTATAMGGTRSVVFGTVASAAVGVLVGLTQVFIRIRSRPISLRSIALSIGAIGILSSSFWLLHERLDLGRLLDRFSGEAIAQSTEGRHELWASSMPVEAAALLMGVPETYPLYSPGSVHPHNLVVSVVRFGGVVPLVVLLAFTGLLSAQLGWTLLQRSEPTLHVSVMTVALMLTVIMAYALASGHFTRVWSLYFLLGFLCALVGPKSAGRVGLS